MSYDYLKGHKCMAWTFMGNSRMYQALAAYGDRLSQVGLFSFKVSRTGIITESGVAISNMLTYINRWCGWNTSFLESASTEELCTALFLSTYQLFL